MTLAFAEDLWFGDYNDEASEQAAARSMMAMAAEVYGVRPFPAAAQKLLSLARNDDFDTKEIVKTIESDATLAARLLRTVNSAAYALPTRVATVQRAVTLLGAQNVRDIALATTLLHTFADGPGVAEELRAHAVAVAGVARFLATECHLPGEDVYVCALLHDLGKLLFLQVREDQYAAILKQTGGHGDALVEAERDAFDFDHAVLGAHVMRAWGLPDPVPAVAAHHHHPARAVVEGGLTARLTSVIRLANLLARPEAYADRADDEVIGELAEDPAARYLNLDREKLEAVWHGVHLTLFEHRPQRSSAGASERDASGPASESSPSSGCARCGETASTTSCSRCQRVYCQAHAPTGERRCADCEAELVRLLAVSASAESSLRRFRLLALVALGGLAVLAAAVPPMRWIALLAALATLPMLIAPLVMSRRQERIRQTFLAESLEEPAAPQD